MIKIVACLSLLFSPVIASAQTRVSASTNYAMTSYGVDNFEVNLGWYIFSVEVEHEFKKDKLWLISGFAAGFRKEGEDIYNGTYLTAGLFRTFDAEQVSVILSGGVIYGLIGLQFDRTRLMYDDGQVVGYQHVSMQRNIAVPGMEDKKAGVLQSVIEIKARKYLKRLFVEGRGGIRLAKFSIVNTNYRNSTYKESIVPMPSVGIGIGYTF